MVFVVLVVVFVVLVVVVIVVVLFTLILVTVVASCKDMPKISWCRHFTSKALNISPGYQANIGHISER